EFGVMGDDEARIDFAVLNAFHQLRKVMLHGGLSHAEGKAAIDGGAHRNFVNVTAVNANDGDHTKVTAALNGLTQNMWPVGAHKSSDFDAVHHAVRAGCRFGLGADSVDAGIGAPSLLGPECAHRHPLS